MKKILFITCLSLLAPLCLNAQTFTSLEGFGSDKKIEWTTSTYGNGFGHKIFSYDPGGMTLLNFAARNNSTTWTNLMTLTSTGNMGIGTTNPIGKLDIKVGGWGNIPSIIFSQTSDHPSIRLYRPTGSANTAYPWWIENNVNLAFKTGTTNEIGSETTTEVITFTREGKVGIATTNPETLLNINVGSGGANSVAGVRIGGLNNYASLELGVDGDYDGMIRSYGNNLKYYAGHWRTIGTVSTENHSHNWYTSKAGSTDWSTIKMTLNQDGNLGIGTTDTKGFKLGVLGKIAAEEVKVAVYNNWPDFVFKKDYNLPSLEEVEQHILEKGHLKNIPSAKDVEENGILLGDMNAKLLQKIEELTLYAIEQEKRIDTLEVENKTLKTQEERIAELEEKFALLLNKN